MESKKLLSFMDFMGKTKVKSILQKSYASDSNVPSSLFNPCTAGGSSLKLHHSHTVYTFATYIIWKM